MSMQSDIDRITSDEQCDKCGELASLTEYEVGGTSDTTDPDCGYDYDTKMLCNSCIQEIEDCGNGH